MSKIIETVAAVLGLMLLVGLVGLSFSAGIWLFDWLLYAGAIGSGLLLLGWGPLLLVRWLCRRRGAISSCGPAAGPKSDT